MVRDPSPSNRRSTWVIAEWVSQVQLFDLPLEVQSHALRSFVNIMGCIVGGSHHEIIGIIEKSLLAYAGQPTATLLGRGIKADPLFATLVNCTSSGVLTFDDTHAEAIVHPSGPVASALLAVSEVRPCSGAQFLLCFAIGVEMLCRLGKALAVLPAQGNMSWLQSAITAPVAVALAVGKLINLDAQKLAWAIGIAAAHSTGLRCSGGSLWSRVAPGEAAQMGLKAAFLAEQGLTGDESAIEGKHGYAEAFSKQPNLAALDTELGERYELLGNTFKPFPCGIVIHPAIDACLRLRSAPGFDINQLEHIVARVNPVTLTLSDRAQPVDAIQAQVSLQHWVATVLLDGGAGIAQLDTNRIHDTQVAALRARVQTIGDADIPKSATDITLTFRSGKVLAKTITDCVGSPSNPMGDGDVDTKFRALASSVLTEQQSEKLLGMCRGLASNSDAATIIAAARGKRALT